MVTKQFCAIQYQWYNTKNNKSGMIVQLQYKFNLKQLLMLNARNQKVQNDEANTHSDNVERMIGDEKNDNIKHTNKENNFMNVLKIIFYDDDCNNWYYFKRVNTLSIIFSNMIDLDLKQQYEWEPECAEMKRKKMQKTCKDSEKKITVKIIEMTEMMRYLNQCLLPVNNINAVLNKFNILLNKVKCCKFGDINKIKYTNILKIDSNDEEQCVNGNTYNIVEFIFITRIWVIFWLLLLYYPKQLLVVLIRCFKLVTMSQEYHHEFEYLSCYCDSIITGLAVRTVDDKIKEKSKSEIVGDGFVSVLEKKDKEKKTHK